MTEWSVIGYGIATFRKRWYVPKWLWLILTENISKVGKPYKAVKPHWLIASKHVVAGQAATICPFYGGPNDGHDGC